LFQKNKACDVETEERSLYLQPLSTESKLLETVKKSFKGILK